MTLCMAAACEENGEPRIAAWSDTRIETSWGGADIGYKWGWVAYPKWHALMADDPSKAAEVTATFRSVLQPEEFTLNNITDKLSEAACLHKEKLCNRWARQKLGVSYERFLTQGEREFSPEIRNRFLYQIETLNFGCDLLIFGFLTQDDPRLFTCDHFGEIADEQDFAAIGSGSFVAESVLFQRQQHRQRSMSATLYCLYEAFRLTTKTKAPGVGEVPNAAVIAPVDASVPRIRTVTEKGFKNLAKTFEKFCPKEITELPEIDDDCLKALPSLKKEGDESS